MAEDLSDAVWLEKAVFPFCTEREEVVGDAGNSVYHRGFYMVHSWTRERAQEHSAFWREEGLKSQSHEFLQFLLFY